MSPIIATILLVAITVVLAAVLYVLISGLTHGPSSAPLGTNFGWGLQVNATGTTPLGCASATAEYCYTLDVASAGGGITTASVTFALHNSVGSAASWPTGLTTISLVSATTAAIVATYTIATSAWAPAAGFNGAFAPGMSVVLYYATGAGHAGLFGYSLVAVGGSGYSGQVVANPFT